MTKDDQYELKQVHVRREFYVIEVKRQIKMIELLITWSCQVEHEWEDRFSCRPFDSRHYTECVQAVFLDTRESLGRLKSTAKNSAGYLIGDEILCKFANTLARWRDQPVRRVWSSADIFDLIDLSKYEP